MWVVGVIMMSVMFLGMFATGESHHGGMFGRGASHSAEQMQHDQVRAGNGQHKMMHDKDQAGHEHGKALDSIGDESEKKNLSSGEVREDGQQPMTQKSWTDEVLEEERAGVP
jgi:hypothetical protein